VPTWPSFEQRAGKTRDWAARRSSKAAKERKHKGGGFVPPPPGDMGGVQPPIDGGDIIDGTIDITPFASTIRPVAIVAALPTLPDTDYPAGSCCVLTTDGKLYRNVAEVWTAAVPTSDLTGYIAGDQIVANSITAGQIAAGAITASELHADAVTADKINVATLAAIVANLGAITAGSLNAVTVSASTITGGTITATVFATGTSGNYVVIDGSGDKDKVQFRSAGSVSSILAAGGGVLIGSGINQKVGFYGATTQAQPTVTGVKSGGTALTSLINKLANIGLIKDSTT